MTDRSNIKDPYIQQLFTYGAKFRHNLQIEDIRESLETGLSDYISKRLQKSRDPTLHARLSLWKEKILEKCSNNLAKYIEKHGDIFFPPFQHRKALQKLKEIFYHYS